MKRSILSWILWFLGLAILVACTNKPASQTSAPPSEALTPMVSTSTLTSEPETNTLTPPTATSVPLTHTITPTRRPTFTPAPAPTFPVPDNPQFTWWNDQVFYEIFVRSFFDSNGDGIGDFKGIIQKLDYLNDGDPKTTDDLGITGIWLMPIFPSPSYHGYDVTDYYNVNPDYGTLDDFKQLVQEAHRRGIKIILDMVINHTSNQHPWFVQSQDPKSPYRDWYIWSATHPGNLGPWGQTVWHSSPAGGYFYGVFWEGMPDLNFQNPAVVTEMNKVATFWLKDTQVDGFRLDGARYYVEQGTQLADTKDNHAFLNQYRTLVKSINPDAVLVGEVWTDTSTVATYLKGDQLDLAFDFSLAGAMVSSANGMQASRSLNTLHTSLASFPYGQFATFLTNHDQERVMTQLLGETGKARNAASLLLTAPGVPFIYYGEEIGMRGAKPDEKIRTPMQWTGDEKGGFTTGTPWESLNDSYKTMNVAGELNTPDSLLIHYRNLIQLRNAHAALRTGLAYRVEASNPSIYALLRTTNEERILVIINLGKAPISDYTLKLVTGPLKDTYQPTSLLSKDPLPILQANPQGGFDSYQPLPTLPGNSILMIELP